MAQEYLWVKVPLKDRKIPENETIQYGLLSDDTKTNEIIPLLDRTTVMRRKIQEQTSEVSKDIIHEMKSIMSDFDRIRYEYDTKNAQTLAELHKLRGQFNDAKIAYENAEKEYAQANDAWIQKDSPVEGIEYDNANTASEKSKKAKEDFISISEKARAYGNSEHRKLFEEKHAALQEQVDKVLEIIRTADSRYKPMLNKSVEYMKSVIAFSKMVYEESMKEIEEFDATKIINIHESVQAGGDATPENTAEEKINSLKRAVDDADKKVAETLPLCLDAIIANDKDKQDSLCKTYYENIDSHGHAIDEYKAALELSSSAVIGGKKLRKTYLRSRDTKKGRSNKTQRRRPRRRTMKQRNAEKPRFLRTSSFL